MRTMNQDFAKPGKYYRDSLDVRLTAEKLVDGSLEDFFSKYISGAAPLPYDKLFSRAGLELRETESVRATLGFTLQREPSGPWFVAGIEAGTSAEKSGLKVGDEILRWNNSDTPRRPERWASQQKAGDELRLRVRRDEKEETLTLHLGEVREKIYEVAESSTVSDRAKRIRDGILRGTTDPVTARNH
jgi:predicted metalloprotease with PDZ domain